MTYLEILVNRAASKAQLNDDLIARARSELHKSRDVLVVICGHGSWTVPPGDGLIEELLKAAADGSRAELLAAARRRGGLKLLPKHNFDARQYSQVVVL